MGLFVNLGSLLSGNGIWRNGRTSLSKPAEEIIGTSQNNENYFGNWMRSVSGSALTDAQREANAYSASREDVAWERQMAARSTAYQSQVADMKAAGINPMLAVSSSGGAALPSASAGSSVSPGTSPLNLGSLLSALSGLSMIPMQRKLMAAEIDKTNADAEKSRADAASTNQQVDFFARIAGYREEGERLSNDMTRSQMKQIEQYIDESKAKEKSALAQSILAKANADNIAYMQPFISAELSAKTDLERKEARVAVLDAAYRQGLLDNHVIEQGVKESNARVAESGSKVTANEAMAELERVQALIAKGDKHALTSELGLLDKIDFWAKDVIGALTDVVKSVPINFVVK